MKKTFIVAFAALFTLAIASVQAQTHFSLNKKGAVVEYVEKAPDGAVLSYSRRTIAGFDVTDARNYTKTVTTETFDADRKPTGKPETETAVVRNGVIEMPTKVEGKKITWVRSPSPKVDLAVGQEFGYEFYIRMMGIKATMISKEKVTARENITTPAGTFDCYKIEADMTLSVMGESGVISRTVSWLSAGVGEVKSETYDAEGKLISTEELISLK